MFCRSQYQAVSVSLRVLVAAVACSPMLVRAAEDYSSLPHSTLQNPFSDANLLPCAACDSGCCGNVACGNACGCGNGKLFGLFAPSDHCYDSFISPMTNPVFFEDPRTLTEARAIYLHHVIPSAVATGGELDLVALQLRAALTDRLSIVAAKDGYLTSSNPLIQDGWANVSAGLKYNLHADPRKQRLLSTGFAYEMPVGTPRSQQGIGDGDFHVYLTGGAEFWNHWHWLSGSGFRLPTDHNTGSTMFYWSNHVDVEFCDGWYALAETNWYNYTRSGGGGINGVEGGDLLNLGSTDVAGNDIVTQAFGLKYKRSRHRELGIAFEFPLTDQRDVLENRLTVDWIFRY